MADHGVHLVTAPVRVTMRVVKTKLLRAIAAEERRQKRDERREQRRQRKEQRRRARLR